VPRSPRSRTPPDEPKLWHGPIVEAVRYREPRRVEDAETKQRWPRFGERMRIAGFRSCLALPLPRVSPAVGGMQPVLKPSQPVHRACRGPGDALRVACGTTFDNAALYDHSRQLVDHLHAALANRDMIGQAKGVLMQRFACDSDAAFDLLRRASQHHNVKVRYLTAELVEAQQQGRLEPLVSKWFASGEQQPDLAAAK
jgi:hypothetical protein